ncbi:MAG: hypothetical protein AAB618_03185 [Patescibacteria group bacterium]
MGSLTPQLVLTVPKIVLTALAADKNGCITVLVDNEGDPQLPSGLNLRPLFLVPSTVKLLKNERRNVFQIPKNCTQITIETTNGRSIGRSRTYFLCLCVIATTTEGEVVWHCDAGPKKAS